MKTIFAVVLWDSLWLNMGDAVSNGLGQGVGTQNCNFVIRSLNPIRNCFQSFYYKSNRY